jgi:hypothetical protein
MRIEYVPRSQISGYAGLYDFTNQTAYIANDLSWWQREMVIQHELDHHIFGTCGEPLIPHQ